MDGRTAGLSGMGVTSETGRSKSHRRKRSQYYEAEVHTSDASIESDDRPSFRLERSPTLAKGKAM